MSDLVLQCPILLKHVPPEKQELFRLQLFRPRIRRQTALFHNSPGLSFRCGWQVVGQLFAALAKALFEKAQKLPPL